MLTHYDEQQLDALGELASIGSGTAATALATLLDRPVELAVPHAAALELADAIDAVGEPDRMVASVVMPIGGAVEAMVLLVFSYDSAATLCELLGVVPRSEVGDSALGEIANILGTSAVGALAQMTGLTLEPSPPQVLHDMLGAIVASVLAETAADEDVALMLDAELTVEGAECALAFLLVPTAAGAAALLARLGLSR